MSRSQDWKN